MNHSPTKGRRPTPSGQHPSVVGFRKKLESIQTGAGAELEDLDSAIKKYLEEVRTPIPPKP
jgi:hypothetical protein